ncbi:hypothetical protein [Turicibacter sp.]|uniref:hypothetical protein n=1 Tax=Turicibacter sp. TaxID=2049042 RepID=UPI001B540B15|nr:hypothetical protein [Turicibacter sp.]MBP3905037.1 hypothetical protein [Turicibacter sp.]MBP3908056.1 hypothetical protein [Turicibacter sp.]
MKKRLAIFTLSIIAVIAIVLTFQYNTQEYIPTEREQEVISQYLKDKSDVNVIKGKTYRIYYTGDIVLVVGNQEDAEKAASKIKKPL